MLWDQGKLEEEITAFRENSGGITSVRDQIATILWEQGKRNEAIKECRAALLEAGSDWPNIKSLLARLLIDQPNEEGEYEHLDEARKLAEEACRVQTTVGIREKARVAREQDAGSRHCTLAMVHYPSGKMDLASLNSRMHPTWDSKNPAIGSFAMTHWQRGDKEEARKWYDRGSSPIEATN